MDRRKEFIKALSSMTGRYSGYQIFSDWAEATAITFRNACHLIHDGEWHRWEKKYLDVVSRYSGEELEKFSLMIALMAESLEEELEDFLGRIFMEAGLGERGTGQFFTPFSVSMMTAKMQLSTENLPEEGHIRLHEPSSGAGGMVIAACRILKERGFDYQRRLDVVAQDIDWRGVYMTYIQLSLIGCRAVVVQGDTLTDPYHVRYDQERSMETPAYMGLIV